MEDGNQAATRLQFGAFEVDLRSGELHKDGVRVKLQELPFRVLAVLLANPGEVVSREELRRHIWPNETFGDFDHAVNVAVGKLGVALGDSPETPRERTQAIHSALWRLRNRSCNSLKLI